MFNNVFFRSSGTQAILDILHRQKPDTVVLPENICPSVLTQVLQKFSVALAPVHDHFEPANYEKVIDSKRGKLSIVFVHPFGLPNYQQRAALNDYDVSVIDDYCLADPLEIINDFKHENDASVFSFGYSKFLDFGGGGMVVSNDYISGTHKLPRLIDNYSRTSKKVIPDDIYTGLSDLPISEFTKCDFFREVKKIHSKRILHQQNLLKIYSKIFDTGRSCLNSPWRFIVKMSADEEKELSRLISASKQNLFYGKNYPILEIKESRVQVKTHIDNTQSVPINLFNDFRFDVNSANKLVEYIQRI